MKRVIITILVIAAVGAGVWYAFGGQQKTQIFGQAPGAELTTIAAIQANPAAYLDKTVTVEGAITKECPASGCWWYVKDATGEMRADSLGAGFALPLNQTGKKVRTTGKVIKSEGGELELAAVGSSLK
jgi:uncharacterized protein YdeI (BOF family)